MRQAHGARRTSRLKRKPQHLLTLEPAPPRPDPHSTCSQEEEADKAALGMCGELWRVLQTPLFVLVAMGYAANIAVVMGFATFGPVYLQV